MKSIITRSALGAFLLASAGVSQAAVTLELISDNDFAVFAGTSTNVTRLLYQNNVPWSSQVANASSFQFDFEAGETSVYLLAMGAGGPENIGGNMNGVNITTVNVSQSSDLSGMLADYATSSSALDAGTYSVTFNEVFAAVPGLTWGAPTLDEEGGVGTFVNGSAFAHPEGSAVIYRFLAEDIGAPIIPAPEPGAPLLGLASALMLLARRRRRA